MRGRAGRRQGRAAMMCWAPVIALTAALSVPISADPPDVPLPERARAVFHFDLARLRQSDLYQEAERNIGLFTRSNEHLRVFLAAAGLLDAANAVQGFTLYSTGGAQDFAGIVEGAFPEDSMRQLERAYEPVARRVGGRVIMPVIQTPEMEVVMSFLATGRLSFGTAPAVESIAVGGAPDPALQAAWRRTERTRPIWGVINAREMIDAVAESAGAVGADPSPLSSLREHPALASLRSVGFSVDIGRDVFFEIRGLTDTAENARLLADAVKGAVALGQLGSSQTADPEVRTFFREVVAESERDGVYISFSLSRGLIDRLRETGDMFSGVVP